MLNQQEYGLFKFQLPTDSERTEALNLTGESTTLKKILLTDSDKFYQSLPAPQEGDHLMHKKEYGQTFDQFSNGQAVKPTPVQDTVYLAQLYYGDNIKLDESFVNGLSLLASSYFHGIKVKLIENGFNLDKPGIAVRKRTSKKTKRLQLNANDIVNLLSNTIPEDGYCFLAFTDQDLYRKNSFCYSVSSKNKRVGVFSLARMDPFFFGNNKLSKQSEEKLLKNYFFLFNRSAKLLVKEVSLQFGLNNCTYYLCVMNGFMNMKEFDRRPLEMCVVCLRKLYALIGLRDRFSAKQRLNDPYLVYERFIKIKDVLNEESFKEIFPVEMKWYENRIKSIKDEL